MFELKPDEARLLLNVALMATGQNRFQSATRILSALEAFRPGHESLAVAKAVLMISMREYGMALGFIDGEALAAHPGSALLRAFRGLALIRLDRHGEAEDCLRAAACSADAAAANLAQGLLGELAVKTIGHSEVGHG